MKQHKSIPTFIINLKKRKDRKEHIIKEFAGRGEFAINIVEAIEHEYGPVGLWQTMTKIIQKSIEQKKEYILICQDDHQFTDHYSKEHLFNCIALAKEKNAAILSGGVSWFNDVIELPQHLFWVNEFSGAQFTIIFNNFYQAILEADFRDNDCADYKMCSLASNKFLIYPFISTQKEFGYSDATIKNNEDGRVEALFCDTEERILHLKNVSIFYKQHNPSFEFEQEAYDNIVVPTYIINLPERTERREHIIRQFEGKKEFDVTIVEACKHTIGAVGLWNSIRKVVQMAIENDDDIIIICEDDHEFTQHYSKKNLFKNILEAHEQGVDYLSGGTGGFSHAIRVTENRYWVNPCLSTQFIIVYRKFFNQILEEPFDDTIKGDIKLSEMTSNKMVLNPFISTQKDFGHSDVTPIHNDVEGLLTTLFTKSSERLGMLHKNYEKYTPPFLTQNHKTVAT